MSSFKYVIFIPAAIVILLIIYLCVTKINIKPKLFLVLLFLLSFSLKGLTVVFLKTEPISDYQLFWKAAQQVANSERGYLQWRYFYVWAYQTGIVFYYSILVKLFGSNILGVQLINCIWMAMTNVLIYLFSKKISNEKSARIISLLYLLYPEPYFLCSTLSNQIIGDFLIYVAALLFLKNKSIKNMIVVGCIIAISNSIRPSGIVFIITIILVAIIEATQQKYDIKTFIKMTFNTCKPFSLVVVSYFLVGLILTSFIKFSGINPQGLKNNFPLYKFVVGLNVDTLGYYSVNDAKLTEINNTKLRNELALSIIRDRLKMGTSKLFNLYYLKLKSMWVSFDTLEWCVTKIDDKDISIGSKVISFNTYSKFILRLEKAYYIIILFLSMLGCLFNMRRKEVYIGFIIPLLLYLCYFNLQLLIEIQVRYRYFAVISLFILASNAFKNNVSTQNTLAHGSASKE